MKKMSSQKWRHSEKIGENQQLDYLNAFDLNRPDQIESLIQIIKSLEPIPQNIRAVKILMQNYGLPIMIYLREFFKKLSSKSKIQHKQQLRSLACIASQLTCGKDIPTIKFIFQCGICKESISIHPTKEEIEFAKFISQIGKMNENIQTKKVVMTSQTYRNFVEKLKKQNIFSNKLMVRSIQDYCLKDTQIQKINKEKKEIKQKSQFFQENGSNSEWSDADSQSQLNDFYKHQVLLQKTNNTSGFSSLSFSLNDSSSFIEFSEKNEHLCCRKFFIQSQVITEKEDIRTAFLQIKQPSQNDITELQKLFCSFLNCEGGKMYFGFEKKSNGKRVVKNYLYTQSQKEQIMKIFRRIAQSLEPDIVTQKLYHVQFIPIKSSVGNFIPGANVIRVTVNYGLRDEVYSYRIGQFDYFPFRNDIQIIQKHGRQLLKIYRNMIKNPLPIPQLLHSYPCKKPDVGEPLHYSTGQQCKISKKQQNKINQSFELINNSLNSTRDTALQRSKFESKIVQKSKITQTQRQNSSSGFVSPQNQSAKEQKHNHQLYTYFFAIGVGERHLSPVFSEKNILQNVQFQSNRQNRLIIRVHGKEETDKARKILKKIETKYKEKNIKIYEISLEMQIENKIDEAIECIKVMKLPYKLVEKQKNTIRFKLFRHSFQAFIELQSRKIPIKFLTSENSTTG